MVNILGDNTFAGSKGGKRSPPEKPGSIDPPGYRGEQRERGEQGGEYRIILPIRTA